MIPGEYRLNEALGDIEINTGLPKLRISVANLGDRPIQVGSHFHFYEVNPQLAFEREQTKGLRLNIPAGMAIRFEPGQQRTVELVPFGGRRAIYGFRGAIMGALEAK
ncbi:urease subunit beta [Shewanella algae]|uniref:urease subunit beta n=1 Tax=Shewanella algae TaxID=38313 RepID=UPI0031F4CB9F